jgi:glutamate synthase domain-containing protein 2/glutamate synthase domain-containing protein 1/glutamate synthase domain-containing protein 3
MKFHEKDACGVGFLTSLRAEYSHEHLTRALYALKCVEHRGACSADQITGDGAGVMTDIPFDMFGFDKDSVAIAMLFVPTHPERQRLSLKKFEETFGFMGLEILEYRNVPVDPAVLGPDARESMPGIKQAFINRPAYCRTIASFDKLLYMAKQTTRLKLKEIGVKNEFFFVSLSASTIVYKALVKSEALDLFYPDLRSPDFKTRFSLFHRRFSTNTRTSWDKVQPFRIIGHNGEINTITGNRSWAAARERYLGLRKDELLTREDISDSGSLNEMVEAMMYRSSNPHIEDILAVMIPPANKESSYYRFWSRAVEPWDGPAFITYSDGQSIGARLDRSGFRPCRWAMTEEHFYLSSEAGSFTLDEYAITRKGALHGGMGVKVDLASGSVHFRDPAQSKENLDGHFDPRLYKLGYLRYENGSPLLKKKAVFSYTEEDLSKILIPMISEGKEPIGSMGDTARLAIFSSEPRSFFDYFSQNFAQVTNPPLDYLREEMVTDLSIHLGKKPNIFAPKELIPPIHAIELDSPVLSLGQMNFIREVGKKRYNTYGVFYKELDIVFKREHGAIGFRTAINELAAQTIRAAEDGVAVIILTDKRADYDNPPIPSLLALRTAVNALNKTGLRLNVSIIVHSGEIRETHHVAALVGFGATAVCPYLALEIARYEKNPKIDPMSPDEKEQNLIRAYNAGLLKIMSKCGIAVVKSYQSSKLFAAVGLGKEIIYEFFNGLSSPLGGVGIPELVENILRQARPETDRENGAKLIHTYQYKEHNKGIMGEHHAMTNTRSKIVHKMIQEYDISPDSTDLFDEYVRLGEESEPIHIRDLFRLRKDSPPLPMEEIQRNEEIFKTFHAGAMSFGAISAEAQRDIFLAMKEIGGKSNSGEGGENPYYYTEGITATIKQVASGRFGVTAEYLVSGKEIQIKIAQGAKPGEGGQLMGVKVNEDIARARHSNPGVDLISPPPLHDIYSIEDLKQMIYEFKQLKPGIPVNVKLVSGTNIGTIAVGVVKAGADSIQVCGGDGGTGAASLSSMKHAGMPWEIGLVEVHKALIANGLRKNVKLVVDGGLHTGKDLIIGAILGANEFAFGKLLLVAEGCVMARICEKNTCPTGIATHDPKFKAKYRGTKDNVIKLVTILAEDVRRQLSVLGICSLKDLIGRTDLLEAHPKHYNLINTKKIDLSYFLNEQMIDRSRKLNLFDEGISPFNKQVVDDTKEALSQNKPVSLSYNIDPTDRAAFALLAGVLAERTHRYRMSSIKGEPPAEAPYTGCISMELTGSAGQGFGAYMVENMYIRLYGEANDSVCKSMSGGKMVIRPHREAIIIPQENSIIGNCTLYGATGGTLYVYGRAGDRFAVRNSGATAVVEGTGLHACEYMTNGTVVILGETLPNLGAGMTGGKVYLYGNQEDNVNDTYVTGLSLSPEHADELLAILTDYVTETGSNRAQDIIDSWEERRNDFTVYLPLKEARKILEGTKIENNIHAA